MEKTAPAPKGEAVVRAGRCGSVTEWRWVARNPSYGAAFLIAARAHPARARGRLGIQLEATTGVSSGTESSYSVSGAMSISPGQTTVP